MKLVNLTPHPVHLPGRVIAPAGPNVAWGEIITRDLPGADGVRLVTRTFGDVHNLPAPEPGVLYVVSAIVRQMCPERRDLASPGGFVRDGAGRITGARYLVVNP